MSQQIIDTTTNNGSYIGDPAKIAFDKANYNFSEIFGLGYRKDNVVGSVSQSGGANTGAILEVLSNSNGTAVRFAGGLQVCFHTIGQFQTSGNGGILNTTWYYAAAFAGIAPVVIPMYSGDWPFRTDFACEGGINTTRANISLQNRHTETLTHYMMFVALGRWYS